MMAEKGANVAPWARAVVVAARHEVKLGLRRHSRQGPAVCWRDDVILRTMEDEDRASIPFQGRQVVEAVSD